MLELELLVDRTTEFSHSVLAETKHVDITMVFSPNVPAEGKHIL